MSNKLSQVACNITSLFTGDQRDKRVSGATIELQFFNGDKSVVVPVPIEQLGCNVLHDVNAYSITIHSNLQSEPSLSGQTLNPIQMDTVKEMVSAVAQFSTRAPDSLFIEE